MPLVHRITGFYKITYLLGQRIAKRDRYGIHLKIEQLCLDTIELAITAALESRMTKVTTIAKFRIKIEVLKQLIRNAYELKILSEKIYLNLAGELREISKMASGWLRYLNREEPDNADSSS